MILRLRAGRGCADRGTPLLQTPRTPRRCQCRPRRQSPEPDGWPEISRSAPCTEFGTPQGLVARDPHPQTRVLQLSRGRTDIRVEVLVPEVLRLPGGRARSALLSQIETRSENLERIPVVESAGDHRVGIQNAR